MYWWVDGIYSNVRIDDRFCLLVISGVSDHGRKELVAVEDGYCESDASPTRIPMETSIQEFTIIPKLATGDGALVFWKALAKCYPDTAHQRCWVHKAANVLSMRPKSVQPKDNDALHISGWPKPEIRPTKHSTVHWCGLRRGAPLNQESDVHA